MENNILTDQLAQKKVRAVPKWGKLIWLLVFIVLAPIVCYYLWTRGFVYFNFSREVYTDYFWFRAPWLFVHVLGGLTASITGLFQFIPAIRARYPVLHRKLGKTYLLSVLIATLVSYQLVATATLGIVYATGLALLGIVWLGSSSMAYFAIRKRNIEMHREWMVKSYVLTLSFVCFRFVEDLLAKVGVSEFIERKVLMAWGCWALPFFITEVVLQLKRLYRKQSSPAA